MSFLGLEGRTFLVTGLKNKKSVAFHVARVLRDEGAQLLLSVRTPERAESIQALFPQAKVIVADAREPEWTQNILEAVGDTKLAGFVHSFAFARYTGVDPATPVMRPFHATPRSDFLEAVQVSCHSFIELSNALSERLDQDASVVTISISTTSMAAENYGYMAPIKAALDAAVPFLAKSFSQFSRVRFNAVCAGLLKTSSSAGIPGYVESFLHAEKATLRKRALETSEVANVVAFLLSPRSAGINAQRLVVDAGMGVNYFDDELIGRKRGTA